MDEEPTRSAAEVLEPASMVADRHTDYFIQVFGAPRQLHFT